MKNTLFFPARQSDVIRCVHYMGLDGEEKVGQGERLELFLRGNEFFFDVASEKGSSTKWGVVLGKVEQIELN